MSDVSAGQAGGDRAAEIEARLEAATPGPWHEAGDSQPRTFSHGFDRVLNADRDTYVVDSPVRKSNAALIAHAPDDLRFLLDENKRLRDALREIEAWVGCRNVAGSTNPSGVGGQALTSCGVCPECKYVARVRSVLLEAPDEH